MFERGVAVKLMFDSKDESSRSRTHQSFAKDADINNIMKKYAVTGVLVDPSLVNSTRQPRFGDFSDLVDYPTLVIRVRQAQSDFMTLPAAVRERFNNDVGEALEFLADPANVKEAVELKLLPESVLPKPPVSPADLNHTPPAPAAGGSAPSGPS